MKSNLCRFFLVCFSIFLSSLISTVNAASEVFMGSWDLDGTGSSQGWWSQIRTGVYQIRIQSPNGVSSYYYVETSGLSNSWQVMGVKNLDADPGAEIVLSVAAASGMYIQVITHKTKTSQNFNVGSPYSVSSWALMGIEDLDGIAGAELLLNIYYVNGGREYMTVHKQGSYLSQTNYSFNRGDSVVLLTDGIKDTDGKAGAEIIVNVAGTSVQVIHDKDKTTRSYRINGSSWQILGYSDLDGIPGNEIVIKNGNYINAINDASYLIKNLFVSSSYWTFNTFQNVDGRAGNEVLVSVAGKPQIITYQ